MPRTAIIAISAAALALVGTVGFSQMSGHGHGGGHGNHVHDEVTMPGLRGRDATPEESAEIGELFRNFRTLERSVENLPDGIRTVTYSTDPQVMDVLVSHVTGMIDRVETDRDPEIIIQSPTLDIFFQRGDTIETEIEVTDEGIVVIQTSTDAKVVTALQVHAAEVTAMAERGMQAVHEMMSNRASN